MEYAGLLVGLHGLREILPVLRPAPEIVFIEGQAGVSAGEGGWKGREQARESERQLYLHFFSDVDERTDRSGQLQCEEMGDQQVVAQTRMCGAACSHALTGSCAEKFSTFTSRSSDIGVNPCIHGSSHRMTSYRWVCNNRVDDVDRLPGMQKSGGKQARA